MPPPGEISAPTWSPRVRLLAVAGIVLAALAAYHNCFRVPFVFDDAGAVIQNPTIRDLRRIGTVLAAQTGNGSGVRSRPLVNLSLAVNYALGGTDVRGYHAFNLAVHVLCALLLFALLRRVFGQCGGEASAFAVALLWAVHPLQTETVICPVQRTESLMALFYLLTLYCFVRGTESRRPVRWQAAAVAACLAGMATKEVMASAPLLVWLYDRTFVAGSFAEAWRRRRRFYAALAGTWILLAVLVAGSGGRGGTVGFGLGVSPWDYGLTQCRALVMYLKLAFWPNPLVVDYGMGLETRLAAVLPQALLLLALLAVAAWALVRRPVAGFAGAWFFVILAPSSSVLPLASQTIAEHRMYLPLAAVLAVAVAGLQHLLRATTGPRTTDRATLRVCGLVVCGLAVPLGWLTLRRNEDYRSELGLWRDTVAKVPDSARAHYNLGVLLERRGAAAEALDQFETALHLKPDYAQAYNNRGDLRFLAGRIEDAAADFALAERIDPTLAEAHYNLGRVRFQEGRDPDAIAEYEAALRLEPDYVDALVNLGVALAREGQMDEALARLHAAVQLDRASGDAQYNLACVFDRAGNLPEAVAAYRAALRLQPDLAAARNNLGYALVRLGRPDEALGEIEEAVRLAPNDLNARVNLANLLASTGRWAEAITTYEAALRLSPADAEIHYALAVALAREGRPAEARRELAEALRLRPDFVPAQALRERLPPTPDSAGKGP